jgi:hypothetical protein
MPLLVIAGGGFFIKADPPNSQVYTIQEAFDRYESDVPMDEK